MEAAFSGSEFRSSTPRGSPATARARLAATREDHPGAGADDFRSKTLSDSLIPQVGDSFTERDDGSTPAPVKLAADGDDRSDVGSEVSDAQSEAGTNKSDPGSEAPSTNRTEVSSAQKKRGGGGSGGGSVCSSCCYCCCGGAGGGGLEESSSVAGRPVEDSCGAFDASRKGRAHRGEKGRKSASESMRPMVEDKPGGGGGGGDDDEEEDVRSQVSEQGSQV